MRKEGELGREKQQKALETADVPPLYGEAVFQLEKLKGNATDQCQRGLQLPVSLCEVWQMFSHFEVSDNCTLLQLSSRNRLNETEHL